MLIDPTHIRNFDGSETPKYNYEDPRIIPIMPRQIVHVSRDDCGNRNITTVSPTIETDRIILAAVAIDEDFARYLADIE